MREPQSRRELRELERKRSRMRPPRADRPPRRPASDQRRSKREAAGRLRGHLLQKAMAVGCMFFAGSMFLATSVPANAFLPSVANAPRVVDGSLDDHVQQLTVADADAASVERDGFSVTSAVEAYRYHYQVSSYTFTNDPNGTIQWPFIVGVPISSTYGYRIAPCSGCSSFHAGVDFVPGAGAPIQAIADGIVTIARDYGSDLGTEVAIQHRIGGQTVTSIYGHMRRGSIAVTVGERVHVGQLVGLVGSTGIATGPHLHLEIDVNGARVNPFAWLKANAN